MCVPEKCLTVSVEKVVVRFAFQAIYARSNWRINLVRYYAMISRRCIILQASRTVIWKSLWKPGVRALHQSWLACMRQTLFTLSTSTQVMVTLGSILHIRNTTLTSQLLFILTSSLPLTLSGKYRGLLQSWWYCFMCRALWLARLCAVPISGIYPLCRM